MSCLSILFSAFLDNSSYSPSSKILVLWSLQNLTERKKTRWLTLTGDLSSGRVDSPAIEKIVFEVHHLEGKDCCQYPFLYSLDLKLTPFPHHPPSLHEGANQMNLNDCFFQLFPPNQCQPS